MNQKGKVVSINGDNAVVRVIRTSACEGCKQKNLCAGVSGGCSEGKPLDVTVNNSAGAVVGDTVLLSSPAGFVLGAAFGVFTAPILVAIAAYFICAAYFDAAAYAATLAAFIVSLVGFSFVLNSYVKKKQPVTISLILENNQE